MTLADVLGVDEPTRPAAESAQPTPTSMRTR